MADEMTPDRVEQLARAAMEPGVQAVRALADVRRELAELLKRDAAAYQEAARHFTPAQLKGFGFEPPVKRVQGRPASGGRAPRSLPGSAPVPDPKALVTLGSQGEGLAAAG